MSDVSIRIDGVDITDIVIFGSATFTTQVNGAPSTAKFRVRDDPHTYGASAIPGKRLTLDIDGDRVWTGYVMGVSRTFALPAMPTGPQYPRIWQIDAVDINILFARRTVFSQSDPTNVTTPLFPAGTNDTTMLNALFANWLDLSGDDLDTSTMIEHVGDVTIGEKGRFGSGGWTWGQAMQTIAMLPGAIFYIDPDRRVVFTDVDTPSAPYGMSDRPTGGQVGYREMELLKDGTKLVNDLLAVGFGFGSSTPVYSREISGASLALHGRWQAAVMAYGVYKQATIDRIADSYVYGSPQSKRGGKDDRVSAEVVTYTPGFRAAQKVNFESEVFGFTDVIPIRKMEITFPVPFDPRYKLLLSHEIDPPWGFIDNLHYPDPKYPPEIPVEEGPGKPEIPEGIVDHVDPPSDYPIYNVETGVGEPVVLKEGVWLSQPVRNDTDGPRVWWIKGGHGILWNTVPPTETVVFPDTFTGFQATAPIQMFAQIRGEVSAATVTAGDTHLKVELVAVAQGEDLEASDEENGGEVIAEADSPNTSGGLRFFGDSLYFEFNDVPIDFGMQFRLNVGIQGLVLIGGPSGRIGFFQTGWMEAHRTANASYPSRGEHTEQYTGDGVNTSFTTSLPFAAIISVTINGIRQDAVTVDHDSHTITFDFAPVPGDRIEVKYQVMT